MATKKRGNQQAKQGRAAEQGYRQGNKPVSRTKPVFTKKEKLHGQELGKTGRAAERGGAVNKTQKITGRRAEEQMYANRMKNTPIKQKLSGIALDVVVAGLTSPDTLRNIQSRVASVTSGAAARAVNKVTGQQVLVHGSPTQGITVINPTIGANRNKGTRGVDLGPQAFFGVPSKNPQFGPSKVATNYALGDQEKNLAQNVVGQGSIYLAKAKKADLIFEQGGTVARTARPVPVIKEIKLTDYSPATRQLLIEDYVSALKSSGGPKIPSSVRKQLRGNKIK